MTVELSGHEGWMWPGRVTMGCEIGRLGSGRSLEMSCDAVMSD